MTSHCLLRATQPSDALTPLSHHSTVHTVDLMCCHVSRGCGMMRAWRSRCCRSEARVCVRCCSVAACVTSTVDPEEVFFCCMSLCPFTLLSPTNGPDGGLPPAIEPDSQVTVAWRDFAAAPDGAQLARPTAASAHRLPGASHRTPSDVTRIKVVRRAAPRKKQVDQVHTQKPVQARPHHWFRHTHAKHTKTTTPQANGTDPQTATHPHPHSHTHILTPPQIHPRCTPHPNACPHTTKPRPARRQPRPPVQAA